MTHKLTRRRLETLPTEALHVARNTTKADVYRFQWPPASEQFAVLKDMRARPLWFRLLAGRFFVRREYRALRALQNIEGVPRLIARLDADGLVMEWRAGTPLMDWKDGTVAPQSLEKVAQIIAAAHARGVVHGDLHRSNVLLAPDGEVTLIDWATAAVFPAKRGAVKGFTFEEWRALDVRALAKLKARHAPQSLSQAEKSVLLGGSKIYALVRGAGFKIRRLLGHRKATSPAEAAARYQQLVEREEDCE